MVKKNILLVNPWIADFAAYDLWAKPMGLLYIGAFLNKYGYDISLLDFLDRQKWNDDAAINNDEGRGKYQRTAIEKPPLLKHVGRKFALYGATESQIRGHLQTLTPPTAILVTSHMTYWYIGLQKSIELLRRYFPETPVIVGGIYATLCEFHAHNNIQADYFIKGYGEKKSLRILDTLHGVSRNYADIPDFDDTLFPPYYLYEKLATLPLMTSRGCPNNCTYCATKKLHPNFSRRSVENLLAEVRHNIEKYGVTQYAFYDDALFAAKEKYIVPFLEEIIKMPQEFKFFSPNGLFAREIDEKLAGLMKIAGFKMVRLSLESAISKWQQASSDKVSRRDFIRAVKYLKKAGFNAKEIEAYLIMGLPGQTFDDVRQSIDFVYESGAISRLASFTPIPGTTDWQRAVKMKLINKNTDPLLTNNTLYPCASEILTQDQFQELKDHSNFLNHKIRQQENLNG